MKFKSKSVICFCLICFGLIDTCLYFYYIKYLAKRQSKLRVFCLVPIGSKEIYGNAKLAHDVWGYSCDKIVYATRLEANSTNTTELRNLNKTHVITVNGLSILHLADLKSDQYDKLTDKMFKSFKYIYTHHGDYEWYLKADDNTFIFMDHLKGFLRDKPPIKPVTYGFDFKTHVEQGYHSGGAGYVLSNEALRRIGYALHNSQVCTEEDLTDMEDIDVAKCLRKLKVYPEKSIDLLDRERFHPLPVLDHYTNWYPDWYLEYASNPIKRGIEEISETSISFHYLEPNDMKRMDELWREYTNSNSSSKSFYKSVIYRFLEVEPIIHESW